MNVDAGTEFGKWGDETSRLIYHDAMPALLTGVDTTARTLDLGGGNGLMREWFPNLTTVDRDVTKAPDVLTDIITYQPTETYDRVLLRYVLHYLSDAQVALMLDRIARWHDGPLLVVQFVNDDVGAKYANSVNERKWFRTEWHLLSLLTRQWEVERRVAVEYDVTPEFYANRLAHPNPTGHRERAVAYDCKVSAP